MKKFHLKTYGCKLNQADSELIRGELSKEFSETGEDEADFVVLNSCGVVEKTERKILKEASRLKKEGKKVIISGCLPAISPEACASTADGTLGPADIALIAAIAENILQGKNYPQSHHLRRDKFLLDKKREKKNACSAIVAASEGCLGGCSYCATRLARKKLISFPMENIVKEASAAIAEGYREIQLTSQDLAVYGLDKGGQKLPELLKKLGSIGGDFRIKVGMMNPGYTKKMLNRLLPVYDSKKIYRFIHLPLQSGSDELLKKMNRGYNVKDFIDVASAFRKKFKDGVIATDIIVGHPLESEDDFEKTVKIIQKIKPDIVHTFKFSKRRGTPDFKLKDLPDRIKKERSRIVTQLFEEINLDKNKKFLGKEYEVIVIEKRKGKHLARTDAGRAIVISRGRIGERRKVKITDYRWNYLIGD